MTANLWIPAFAGMTNILAGMTATTLSLTLAYGRQGQAGISLVAGEILRLRLRMTPTALERGMDRLRSTHL
jgi:hypothetical protein